MKINRKSNAYIERCCPGTLKDGGNEEGVGTTTLVRHVSKAPRALDVERTGIVIQ
jgi:hypothetical protein